MSKRKVKAMDAWADVGSHGGIFVFEAGPVALHYPRLMHIYDRQVTRDLVPVRIIARRLTPKTEKGER